MKKVLNILILLALIGFCHTAGADNTSPLEAAKNIHAIIDHAKSSHELIKYFDIDHFAELALYQHWSQWSDQQRDQFKSNYLTMISKKIEADLKKARPQQKPVALFGVKSNNGTFAEITAKSKYRGTEYTMNIYLINHSDGWKVYDFDLDGVNLIRNYRAQFNKLIRIYGYSGLITRMEKMS